MDDFEVTAVSLHAEGCAFVLCVEVAFFFSFEVVSSVSDGEVDAIIWTDSESVKVMATQAYAYSVSFLE